jgi:hypothetical protein
MQELSVTSETKDIPNPVDSSFEESTRMTIKIRWTRWIPYRCLLEQVHLFIVFTLEKMISTIHFNLQAKTPTVTGIVNYPREPVLPKHYESFDYSLQSPSKSDINSNNDSNDAGVGADDVYSFDDGDSGSRPIGPT